MGPCCAEQILWITEAIKVFARTKEEVRAREPRPGAWHALGCWAIDIETWANSGGLLAWKPQSNAEQMWLVTHAPSEFAQLRPEWLTRLYNADDRTKGT